MMHASLPVSVPRPMAVGAILALIAVLFGFILGGGFGLAEDTIKGKLQASGEAALAVAYQGDTVARDAVVSKSWDYLKRAHMHGGGIGASALATIAILILLARSSSLASWSALSFGAGALLYSAFWLWAGLIAPGLGSTGAARRARLACQRCQFGFPQAAFEPVTVARVNGVRRAPHERHCTGASRFPHASPPNLHASEDTPPRL